MTDGIVWKDRKRTLFGLPLSFTRYSLPDEKLIIDTGFFSRKEEEIRLYRIRDLTLKRPLAQRMLGLGTIHCCSADVSSPEFDILRIKNSKKVKDMLSDMVEKQREQKRVGAREIYAGVPDGEHPDEHFDDGCDCD